MTTNNISQKQIFSYLVSTFNYWGITYITQQTIKNAKKNKPQSSKHMKTLLFHLIILHMFDYRIDLGDYFKSCNQKQLSKQKSKDLSPDLREQQMDEIILAYLSECECPLLLQLLNQKKQQDQQQNNQIGQDNKIQEWIGCNLQSSRILLLLCGWVMGVSDYFNQILPKVITKLQSKIQNPQKISKAINSIFQNKINNIVNQKDDTIPQAQQIMKLYKSIQNHKYQVECLQQKTFKVKSKIQQKLKKYSKINNVTITVDDILLTSGKQQEQTVLKMEQQLKYIISNEIQNMNQRKYFWIWLEERMVKQFEKQLKSQNQRFEQVQSQNFIEDIKVDLEYLSKYIQLCNYYTQKCQQLTQKIQKMKLSMKKSKQIQSQVKYQFKQTLTSGKYPNNKKHLFIALQLKGYMNVSVDNGGNVKKDQQGQTQNNQKQIIKSKKKLKKQLQRYLNQIEEHIKFL